MKFIYIVGLPIWGSMYGEFQPNTIKVFTTNSKALRYKQKKDQNTRLISYEIMRRKLN